MCRFALRFGKRGTNEDSRVGYGTGFGKESSLGGTRMKQGGGYPISRPFEIPQLGSSQSKEITIFLFRDLNREIIRGLYPIKYYCSLSAPLDISILLRYQNTVVRNDSLNFTFSFSYLTGERACEMWCGKGVSFDQHKKSGNRSIACLI